MLPWLAVGSHEGLSHATTSKRLHLSKLTATVGVSGMSLSKETSVSFMTGVEEEATHGSPVVPRLHARTILFTCCSLCSSKEAIIYIVFIECRRE